MRFFLLVSMWALLGCTSDPKPKVVNDESVELAKKCAEAVRCTREYKPTSCSFGKVTMEGNNPCLAKAKVAEYACRNELELVEGQVTCVASTAKPKVRAVQTAKVSPKKMTASSEACKNMRRMCTFEYRPAVCNFEGKKISGSNKCTAMNAVYAYACQNKLVVAQDKVECEFAEVKQ